MNASIFDYREYKAYLMDQVGGPGERKGVKSAIARTLRCQPTYVSQVINGRAHFSLEQAEMLSRFFGHTDEEQSFFLLLVQKDRAGTAELKHFFQGQIDRIVEHRLTLTRRLGTSSIIPEEHRAVYYSAWYYTAIHIALTIPQMRTVDALANGLGLSKKKVTEVLDFFVSTGLAIQKQGHFIPGTSQVRLGNDSHHIIRHHSSFRQKAIESLEREEITDFHYSATVSLSREDVIKIKDKILETLKENLDTIRASKEEELFCYTIDFFNLRK